ncbi:MAG: hypothetical protein PHS04_15520 [Tissierellia bacterium]|nr:hypothetical protein [Tissierellia bacterium]
MIDSLIRIIVITLLIFMHVSCIDKDVYEGDNGLVDEYISYLYPYQDEAQNIILPEICTTN